MTIRSKVGAAAVTVLAPEAEVAEAGAAKVGAKGAKAGAKKITPGQSRDQVNAELQRRRKVAAIRARQRAAGLSEGQTQDEADDARETDSGGEPAAVPLASSSVPSGAVDAVHAGGGFALGLVTYVVVLTYIKGGMPAVKQLANAKLFNKTGATK